MPKLDALLSRQLNTSKAKAREVIAEGAVAMPDGSPVNARAEIPPDRLPLTVLLDGEPLVLHEHVHLMLNKPTGVITALRDNNHKIAYDLLDQAPLFAELRPVGRLDLDTSGLLLWTSDGQWLQKLTHPKRRVPRTYQAVLARPFTPAPADLVLEDGHRPDIISLRTISATDAHPALARPDNGLAFAEITLIGGAYHEVRRIFAALDSHVLALCRTQYGSLALPTDLAPSEWRLVAPTDVV